MMDRLKSVSQRMGDARQIRVWVIVSLLIHVVLFGIIIIVYSFRSPAGSVAAPPEPPIVALYEVADIPPNKLPQIPALELEDIQNPADVLPDELSDIPQPTPTTKATLTPTPTPTTKATLTPTPVPKVQVTPTLKPLPTPKPQPTPTPDPRPTAVAFEVPRRQGVLKPWPDQDIVISPTPEERMPKTPISQRTPESRTPKSENETPPTISRSPSESQATSENSRQHALSFSNRLARETALMFETANDFPYPVYLSHIKEKIEGLWFPEGAGTVSILLVIDKNGKILKSGVDKGSGFDVNKLRDSVIRAVTLIQSFQPLPADYRGSELQVRITVRR